MVKLQQWILSINGRHAHRLAPLIQKICLPTLVIADLDPAKDTGNHESVLPERKKNIISSNYTITGWLLKQKSFDTLTDLPAKNKIVHPESTYEYSIRIAYQTPVSLTFNGAKVEALSGTFEDCLIYTNFDTFRSLSVKDAGGLVKKVHEAICKATCFEDVHQDIYSTLKNGSSTQKAEFALDVIYEIDPSEIIVPRYITEGLQWLQDYFS